jgi:hypothetical protein
MKKVLKSIILFLGLCSAAMSFAAIAVRSPYVFAAGFLMSMFACALWVISDRYVVDDVKGKSSNKVFADMKNEANKKVGEVRADTGVLN